MLLAPSTYTPDPIADPVTVTIDTLAALPTLVLVKRTDLGISPQEAAQQISIGLDTYLRIEAGTARPTWVTLGDVLVWLTS